MSRSMNASEPRRVREDHPLGRGVRDVALVPQRHVLERRDRVAADHARQPADALAHDRVPLVRHRARALLPVGERLLHLADLGARQVADLGRRARPASRRRRPAPQRTPRAGRAGSPGCDASAGCRPSRSQTSCSTCGSTLRVGAHHAADRADAHGLARTAQPRRGRDPAGTRTPPACARTRSARRGRRGNARCRPCRGTRARDAARPRATVSSRRGARRRSPAAAARAPCPARRRRSARNGSSGPPSPIDAATTSTNAATSWRVTRSRSNTARDVERSPVAAGPRVVLRDHAEGRPMPRRPRARSRASSSSAPRRTRSPRSRARRTASITASGPPPGRP